MFGENNIYLERIVKIDSKNRIVLSQNTYAENEDTLVVLKYDDYLCLRNIIELDEKLEQLDSKMHDNPEKYKIYMQIKEELAMKVIGTVKIDKQRRIILSKEWTGYADENKELVAKGIGRELRLYNKEKFEKIKTLNK